MGRYQHLPLYDALYRYTNELYKLKKTLPRDLKHDLVEAAVSWPIGAVSKLL
jgi:hypothetical protein